MAQMKQSKSGKQALEALEEARQTPRGSVQGLSTHAAPGSTQ